MNNNNDYKDKQLLINNLEPLLTQYLDAYSMYFVTLTFKSKSNILNESREYKKADYDSYFRLFKNRLNNLALRNSKQKNKCVFFAFPEKSYYNHKFLNQENLIITNRNRSQPSFRSQDLPNHYHCILLVHNQHQDRFERKCTKKYLNPKTGKISKSLSDKLANPYPKDTAFEETNLFIQDTDIQLIDDLDGVIKYSTKNILSLDFNYDDIYIYVSKNSMENN